MQLIIYLTKKLEPGLCRWYSKIKGKLLAKFKFTTLKNLFLVVSSKYACLSNSSYRNCSHTIFLVYGRLCSQIVAVSDFFYGRVSWHFIPFYMKYFPKIVIFSPALNTWYKKRNYEVGIPSSYKIWLRVETVQIRKYKVYTEYPIQ